MRSFVIAAMTTALVAGLAFLLAPPPTASSRGAPSADAETLAGTAGEEGESAEPAVESTADERGAPARAGAKRVFYQWTDERGSVRFAQTLDEVPAAWRERAGQVEIDTSAYEAKPARPPAAAGRAPRKPGAGAAAPERRDFHDVTVYTAPWCGWCRKTLAFLDQRGIDYVNKDIEADDDYAVELAEKSGGNSIPFIEIDGTQIRGYNPRQMTALLE